MMLAGRAAMPAPPGAYLGAVRANRIIIGTLIMIVLLGLGTYLLTG
jgi:hypothetical protein